MQTSNVLLPSSPNWFCQQTFHARQEDNLVAIACFRNIIVCQITSEVKLPNIVNLFQCQEGKCTSVRLFDSKDNKLYGNTVVSSSDRKRITLWNFLNGEVINSHQGHKFDIRATSWAEIEEKHILVSVGAKGELVLWDPNELTPQVNTIANSRDLNLIETLPHKKDEAIIGAEKALLHMSLKDCHTLHVFKGHDQEIYSFAWYHGTDCPITDPTPTPNGATKSEEDSTTENAGIQGNWRDKKVSSNPDTGPFFATSDSGRNVLIWSFWAKRYAYKFNVPTSSSGFKKNAKSAKQQITVGWHKDRLLVSTPHGELMSWPLGARGTSKLLHHLHTRVIYNMVVLNDVVLTSAQDRFIVGYDLEKSKQIFQVPTLGATSNALAICPQDPNMVALGAQDGYIRVFNFASQIPLASKNFQNIKGKIFSLNWHPLQEGLLLFGTSDGQVGYVDINSGRVNQFAFFHQKCVYKTEWAPKLLQSYANDGSDELCAYSFGDGKIAMRDAKDLNADPVFVKDFIPEEFASHFIKDITEFSFSSNYKYLALGAQDGKVQIFETLTMKLLVTYVAIRKPIQHILWKPITETQTSYLIAVGSNESKVFLFNLDDIIKEGKTLQLISHATSELNGHSSRVLWLSWSPYDSNILASASHDKKVKVWNTQKGEQIASFDDHISRVLRVEFSLFDSDSLFSISEDNDFRLWKLSKIMNAPTKQKEKKVTLKTIKLKEERERETISPASSTTSVASYAKSKLIKKELKLQEKTLFPKYHLVATKKKHFHLVAILGMCKYQQTYQKHQILSNGDNDLEDELDDCPTNDSNTLKDVPPLKEIVEESFKEYGFLCGDEPTQKDIEDIISMLDFFGGTQEMSNLMNREIEYFEEKEYYHQRTVLNLWNCNLESEIKKAAQNKTLTPFLVSLAPQVSFQLWESTCEAFAQQLTEEGEIMAAASYYISINKISEAVNLLIKHRLHKEAVAVAKCRGRYDIELQKKAINAWLTHSLLEGSYERSSLIQASIGQLEESARHLTRRSDSGSILTAAEIYRLLGKDELADATLILGIKEASIKNEFNKVQHCVLNYKSLHWYKPILLCQKSLVELIDQIKGSTEAKDSFLFKKKLCCQENQHNGEENEEHSCTYESMPFLNYFISLLEDVPSSSYYQEVYQQMVKHFSTQQNPSSGRQMWSLISVAICKFVFANDLEEKKSMLLEIFNYVNNGKKNLDPMYYLTHILLPFGISDMSTLELPDDDTSFSKCKTMLKEMFCLSELSVYDNLIDNKSLDFPWTKSNKETNVNGEVALNHDSKISNGHDSVINILEKDESNSKPNNCDNSEYANETKDESIVSKTESKSTLEEVIHNGIKNLNIEEVNSNEIHDLTNGKEINSLTDTNATITNTIQNESICKISIEKSHMLQVEKGLETFKLIVWKEEIELKNDLVVYKNIFDGVDLSDYSNILEKYDSVFLLNEFKDKLIKNNILTPEAT